jgi:DNA repair exonuclease SbcCD nuclease subunit
LQHAYPKNQKSFCFFFFRKRRPSFLMKFLHAADIHLDSPLAGLTRRARIPPHVLQHCTRRAFVNLIDLAITEDVAFLLIAGDLYDGDWRDFSTGLFFIEQMRRLARPCILVRGNHDAASIISRQLTLPPNVVELSSRKVERWVSEELGVVVHGRSFPDRHIAEDFSEAYPGPEPGKLSIAMLHTSAEDPGEHEVYAPCRVASLAGKGYAYWALGHIHARAALRSDPWIVFPGNIQGRHIRETGAKGATLVEVADGAIVGVSNRPVDVLRWARIEADLEGVETVAEAAMRLRFAFEAGAGEAEGRPLIVRLVLRGATPLHGAFATDPRQIEAECQSAAHAAGDDIFVERVVMETCAPSATGEGAMQDLANAFAAGLDDPETLQKLLAEFTKLRQDIPFVQGAKADLPQNVEDLRALLRDAWHLAEQFLRAGDAA